MKPKITLVCSALLISLLNVIGCASHTRPPMEIVYQLPYEDFITRGSHLKFVTNGIVGDTLVITLGSKPSTGFVWPDIAQISDQDILKQIEHIASAPRPTVPLESTVGDTWKFKVTKPGTVTVIMTYSHPSDVNNDEELVFKAVLVVDER